LEGSVQAPLHLYEKRAPDLKIKEQNREKQNYIREKFIIDESSIRETPSENKYGNIWKTF